MFPALTLDVIGTGIVGLLLAGYVLKNSITSFMDARKTLRTSSADPIISAMGSTWDRDQMERILQACETMAECLESIAKEQKDTSKERTEKLLDRLEQAEMLGQLRRREEQEEQQPRRTPPARRRQ